jgi:hypothetical protein
MFPAVEAPLQLQDISMKKLYAFLFLSACTTSPKSQPKSEDVRPREFPRVTVIGTETAQIKSPSLADLTDEDWKQTEAGCVTHLYQCQYDEQGQVTEVKALDQSEPTFQAFTEEALRAWRFEAGKGGSCFAQVIYEENLATRVLVVPQDMAHTMMSNLQKNRAAMPKPDRTKTFPSPLHQPKIKMPKDMILKGQSGFIIVNFDLDPEGVPINLKVIDEEPEGAFEKDTLRTIKGWRYAKLADEPNSMRNVTTTIGTYVASGQALSTCDVGLKLNRLAKAQLSP